jgi:hypothetical protein
MFIHRYFSFFSHFIMFLHGRIREHGQSLLEDLDKLPHMLVSLILVLVRRPLLQFEFSS